MLSTPLERFGQQVSRIFVDYCGHSSLAGVAHITNRRHHWTERLFWTICILIGWLSALLLIRQYVELFQRTTISVAVENVDIRTENSTFPAVGICEMGYTKQVYPRLEALVESLRVREEMEYSYDVEDFMLRIVFQNLYNNGAFAAYCEREESCEECVPCPYDGYQRFAALVRANCSELFDECRWNGEPFECCQYFQPIQTTVGLCFLLNSIQTVNRYGQHWLRMEVNKAAPKGELLLKLHLAASTYLLNEEDIPHMLLQRLQFDQTAPGTLQKLHVTLQNIVNDPEVRNVDIAVRRCLFPDERINSNYGKYSYAVCVTECLKREQLRVCNCYYHNMLLDQSSDNSSQVCNFDGINCLDKHNLMAPETKVLQPWRTHGLFCRCHPSCTEHDIRVVGKEMYYNDGMDRTVMINLITLPTQRYRRQVVRQIIDVVVSFGGILGLFTGASILSLAEFVYFFTVRFAFNWGDNERDNARDGSQSSDIDDDMIVQRQVHF